MTGSISVIVDGKDLKNSSGTGLTRYAVETLKSNYRNGFTQRVLLGEHVNTRTSHPAFRPTLLKSLLNGEVTNYRAGDTKGIIEPLKLRFSILQKSIVPALRELAMTHSVSKPISMPTDVVVDSHMPLQQIQGLLNRRGIYEYATLKGSYTQRAVKLSLPVESNKSSVFHLTNPIPLTTKSMPTVVTVHDLIPLIMPQGTLVPLKHYYNYIKASLRNCDAIACISQASAEQLLSFYPEYENKVSITYQSVEMPDLDDEDTETRFLDSLGIAKNEYFLFNAAVEPKKNLGRVLDAYLSSSITMPLVVLGPKGWMSGDLEKRCCASYGTKSVRRIHYLERSKQLQVINGARALVFPSLIEGFGLPVLEAMSLATPVITSNRGSLKEIAQESAILVSPESVEEIRQAMECLATDDTVCQELGAKGLSRSRFFSPEQYDDAMANIFKRLV